MTVDPSGVSNKNSGLPSLLVGKTLHWLLCWVETEIQFGLATQSVSVNRIENPPGENHSFHIIHLEDGGVALATLSCPRYNNCSLKLWERMDNSSSVTSWVLVNVVTLNKILDLGIAIRKPSSIVRYSEDDHAIFLRVRSHVCMLQLKTMRGKRIYSKTDRCCTYHPFTSFVI